MTNVTRDHREIVGQSNRGDSQVRLGQGYSCLFQLSPQPSVGFRRRPVERQDADVGPQALLQLTKEVIWPVTAVCAVDHFTNSDSRGELLFGRHSGHPGQKGG